jgi:hypothetical protein
MRRKAAEPARGTYRQRMLAVLQGRPADRMPWVPRLDLWYNARRRAGTLPPRFRGASLRELTDALGWGYHAVIPNFKDVRVRDVRVRDLRGSEDEVHRALGIYSLRTMPVRTVLDGVRFEAHQKGDETRVTYETPAGTVTTTVLYDESMRRAGITITHITEYAIKSPADYRPVSYLFEAARVEENPDGYREFRDYVGDRGLAVGFLSLAASPMHLLQRELMPLERFFLELYDHPAELAACAGSIGGYFRGLFAAAAESPAEMLLLGANYDARVTYPPFFREHIQPWLAELAGLLHARHRYLLTHTDGENRGLLDCYLDSGFDVADSVCPRPMTSLSLAEVRERFGGRITIMGGIPSVSLLPDSMNDRQFEEFLDRFFADLGTGDHLVLGISDTTPPAAELDRLLEIARRVESFGPVGARQDGRIRSTGETP